MHSVKTIRLSSLGLKVLTAYVVGALLSIALAVAAAVWTVEHDVLADLELRERAVMLAGSTPAANLPNSMSARLTWIGCTTVSPMRRPIAYWM